MRIDCDTCVVRGPACADCVVTFLTIPVRPAARADAPGRPGTSPALVAPPRLLDDAVLDDAVLDDAEQAAVAVLAAGGLVPPLRMAAGG